MITILVRIHKSDRLSGLSCFRWGYWDRMTNMKKGSFSRLWVARPGRRVASSLSLLGVLLLAFALGGCRLGSPDYQLTVEWADGITGTPAAGSYTWKEFTEITYEYGFVDGSEAIPGVYLDDNPNRLAASGSLQILAPTRIYVGDVDVRGAWDVVFYTRESKRQYLVFTFSGTSPGEGTFSDDTGRTGTWTLEEGKVTMAGADWEPYQLSAAVGPRRLGGEWRIIEEGKRGYWSAQRR